MTERIKDKISKVITI
jgi:hypothetical protein